MKNKKGFTLIELLAVIVILSILILIALPSVLNIMNKARRDAFKDEAASIASAAENAYAVEDVSSSECTITYKDLTDNKYINKKDNIAASFTFSDGTITEIEVTDSNTKLRATGSTKNDIKVTKENNLSEAPNGEGTCNIGGE